MVKCECLFNYTYGPRDVTRSPYMIDPECRLHGYGGTDRCKYCRSLRQPCGCNKKSSQQQQEADRG